jgi:hypothetical protein
MLAAWRQVLSVAIEHGVSESSLQVMKTTYSGLQEHRIIVYTATGQKAMPKVHMTRKPQIQEFQAKHQKHAEGKQRNAS